MQRYLYSHILEDLSRKMVFITGPRQVGKTWLAKEIQKAFTNPQYFNFDNINDQRIIRKMSWANNADLLIFDEIHKMKNWKNYIKGVFDGKPPKQSILVTGSARLDTFRKTGDSLVGRYFLYRLHPFSVKELADNGIPEYEAIELLNETGGFPEPLIARIESEDSAKGKIFSARWHNQYVSNILREDIFELGRISEINSMKILLELLRERVGAPVSYLSLSRDLQISPNTVKKYIEILESLFIIFMVRPYHKNVARAILREPKIYFYDSSLIKGDDGLKLENTVALSLLKHVQFLGDSLGLDLVLGYLRNKDNKEVDFIMAENGKIKVLLEVKLSDIKISPSLKYFSEYFAEANAYQLVHNLKQNETLNNINITKAGQWLSQLSA